jgi:transposase
MNQEIELPTFSASRRTAGWRSVLQVDGYAGFERLTGRGDIILAACWGHTRRKFYDVHEATASPIAAEALRRIAELYAIEIRAGDRPCAHTRPQRSLLSRLREFKLLIARSTA